MNSWKLYHKLNDISITSLSAQPQRSEETGIADPQLQILGTESNSFTQTQALPSKTTLKEIIDQLQPTLSRIKLDEKTITDYSKRLQDIFSAKQSLKHENNANISTDQRYQLINDAINRLHTAYLLGERTTSADVSELKVLWIEYFNCLDEARNFLEKAMETMEELPLDP